MAETAPSVLDRDVQIQMLEYFVPLAEQHAAASGGKLSVLPIDPEKYPGQVGHIVEGAPMTPQDVRKYAGIVVPNFVELADAMKYRDPEIIQKACAVVDQGGSIHVPTSHQKLIYPAYGLVTPTNIMRREGQEFDTEIAVGKMLSLLAHDMGGEKVPTIEVLRWFCDRVHVSIPHSETIKNSPILEEMPKEVAAHNALVKAAMEERIARGRVVMGAAWSGTTDKRNALNLKEIVFGRVNDGTAELATHKNAWVAPVVLDLSQGQKDKYIEFSGKLRQLKTIAEVHELLNEMAAYMSAKYSDGRKFVYEGAERVQQAIKGKVSKP